MDNKEIQRDGFVFYASAWQNVLDFRESNPELGDKLLKAIIDYGFYKDYDKSDPLVRGAMANIIISIDNAADRHVKAQAGGQKSASKTKFDREQIYELLDQGLTHKEVADIIGCKNTKTIQRAVKERQSGQDKTDICPADNEEVTFNF
jgi:hypothetical protein